MSKRNRRCAARWIAVTIPLVLACGLAGAETLEPSQDSTMLLQHPDNNYGSSAGLAMGYYVGTGTEERILMMFDLSGVEAPIGGATVTWCITYDYNESVHLDAEVHRLTQAWTEDGVSWNTYDGVIPWAAGGGDYDPAVVTSVNVGSTVGTCHEFDVTGIVLDWLDGAYPNYGLLFMSPGYVSSSYTAFGARENGDPAIRPYLVIDEPIFVDGFESGDTTRWSASAP